MLASELVFHTAKYNVRQRNKKEEKKKQNVFGVFTPVVVCIEQFQLWLIERADNCTKSTRLN